MQTQTSFVGSDGTVELYTVSFVYLYLSFIIHPGNAEHHNSLRLNQTLQESFFSVLLLIGVNHRAKRIQHLFHCLMELRLAGVLGNH